MKKTMEYRGYNAKIEYSDTDNCFWGEILYINDEVSFEGQSIIELKIAFKEAVDDYIETCTQIGKEPEKPFKGSFNVRISSELHKKAAIKAASEGLSLNQIVEKAIKSLVRN